MSLIGFHAVASGAGSVGDSAFADAANAVGANMTSTVASAVWTLDANASALVPAWTNSDGSIALATLLYDRVADALLLVGDINLFVETMNADVTNVVSHQLYFVSHY
jgi:hypothetical protein